MDVLKEYQKTINQIDDYLEYRFLHDTEMVMRNRILGWLDDLTKRLKEQRDDQEKIKAAASPQD